MLQVEHHLNRISYVGKVMVIKPPSEVFDRFEIVTMRDAWLEAIEYQRPTKVVVSFDQVAFFASEAIGVLLQLSKRIRQYGGDVKLCSMGRVVREIFDICQLVPDVFELHASTSDAIDAFE